MKLGMPLQSNLKRVMDLFALLHLHSAAQFLSQQSLTDDAKRNLTLGPVTAQNWIAGAGEIQPSRP
jgi:hypothetical protein